MSLHKHFKILLPDDLATGDYSMGLNDILIQSCSMIGMIILPFFSNHFLSSSIKPSSPQDPPRLTISNVVETPHKQIRLYKSEEKELGFINKLFYDRVSLDLGYPSSLSDQCSVHFPRPNNALMIIGAIVLSYCLIKSDIYDIFKDVLLKFYIESYFYDHHVDTSADEKTIEEYYTVSELEQFVIGEKLDDQYFHVDDISDDGNETLEINTTGSSKASLRRNMSIRDFKSLSMFHHEPFEINATDLTLPHSFPKYSMEYREQMCETWELLFDENNE